MMMSSSISTLKPEVMEALQRYSDYAFLWEKDRQEAVRVGFELCNAIFYNLFSIHVECCLAHDKEK